MKKFLYTFVLVSLMASCATTRQKSYPGSESAPPPKKLPDGPPVFLENISIKPTPKPPASTGTAASTNDKPLLIKSVADVPESTWSIDIEKSNYLQFKYAILLDAPVESVLNKRLISFMDSWYGVPYKFGGINRKGIDCSAFTSILMDSVYAITLPRTAREQYEVGKKIKVNDIDQGDLVFFNTTGGVSHVGIYIANNKFLHASLSGGVMVSDLDHVYFKRRYIGACRVR